MVQIRNARSVVGCGRFYSRGSRAFVRGGHSIRRLKLHKEIGRAAGSYGEWRIAQGEVLLRPGPWQGHHRSLVDQVGGRGRDALRGWVRKRRR